MNEQGPRNDVAPQEEKQPSGVIRVAIADDHRMVRDGLRSFLSLAKDIVLVGEASTGAQAVGLAASVDVDVFLMDLIMPGDVDGFAAIQTIASRAGFRSHVIALTSFAEPDFMLRAIEAGAIGFLQKDVSPDDLVSAIRQAAAGRSVLEPQALLALRDNRLPAAVRSSAARTFAAGTPARDAVSAQAHDAAAEENDCLDEPLTERETEVLQALARGMSNKEIGVELGITEKTVKVHISHILSKLGVYDRTQALIAASKLGLVRL